VNAGAPEGLAFALPLMAPVALLLNDTNKFFLTGHYIDIKVSYITWMLPLI